MRANISLFMVMLLMACGQNSNSTNPVKALRITTVKPSRPAARPSVYHQLIPTDVHAYLASYLPAWHLPGPERWESTWFNDYQKNGKGNLVNYVKGCFNADATPDYAFILVNNQRRYAVWALLSNGHRYKPSLIWEAGNASSGKIEIGIELIKKGKLQYMTLNSDTKPQPIDLKTDALSITSFEKTSTAYYWENGELKSVTTGD